MTPAPLRDALREARTAVGLTQQEAARQIGVSMGTVARWEQGRITPSGQHLEAAAKVYEADFGLTVEPSSVRELEARVAELEGQVRDLTRLVKRRPR